MLLLACVLAVAGCAHPAPAEVAAAPAPKVGTVLDGPVPRTLLDLRLVDERGRGLTLGSLRGKVVVVSDMSTLCQETCAIGTASMLAAARASDRAGLRGKVEFLSITIDPGRDDRRHLAAYRRAFGAPPHWRTLTGSPADIRLLWDRLGVWRRMVQLRPPYDKDWVTGGPLAADVQHTDDLVFIGPDQRFRYLIDGPGTVPSPQAIPGRIYDFMSAQGHRNVRNTSSGSWSAGDVERVLRWLVDENGASS